MSEYAAFSRQMFLFYSCNLCSFTWPASPQYFISVTGGDNLL